MITKNTHENRLSDGTQPSAKPLNILYLEDNPSDVDLLEIELSKSGPYHLHTVDSRDAFEKQLNNPYDLLLLDYRLPDVDGREALKLIRDGFYSVPAIILSGTVGEEEAVALMHDGASDFLLKENLHKIHHVIERVLREEEAVKKSREYLRELEDKNALLDSLLDGLDDLMFFKDASHRYMKANQAFCGHFKINEQNLIGKTDRELFGDDIARKSELSDQKVLNFGKSVRYTTDYLGSNGKRTISETIKTPIISNEKVIGLVGVSRDVTRSRLLEEQLRKNQIVLSQAEDMVDGGSFEYNSDSEILRCTPNLISIFGLDAEYNQISLTKFYKLIYEPDRSLFVEQFEDAVSKRVTLSVVHRVKVGAQIKHFKTKLRHETSGGGHFFYGTMVDSTQERTQDESVDLLLEGERKRISRELHDGIGQKLSAASMYISHFLSSQKSEIIEKALSVIRESTHEVRSISHSLSVKMVEENGLRLAIEDLLDRIPKEINQQVTIDIDEESIDLFIASHLYRIVQEVISNMMKYSNASFFELVLTQERSILILKIQDNGDGFDLDESSSKGNGVNNILHRVKRCHGIIRIQTAKNKGFALEIKVPVK